MFKVISNQLSVISNVLSVFSNQLSVIGRQFFVPATSGISKPLLTVFLVFLFILIFSEPTMAQCPMCKASAEASLKGGSNVARGLNKGILYLLIMPYLLFTVIFFMWYKNYKKKVVVG